METRHVMELITETDDGIIHLKCPECVREVSVDKGRVRVLTNKDGDWLNGDFDASHSWGRGVTITSAKVDTE